MFRREAVRLMETRGERSIKDVADSLGVTPPLLYDWRRKYEDVSNTSPIPVRRRELL